MKTNFHKIIYDLGLLFRNNLIFEKYNFLKNSENWAMKELEAYQLEKLKNIVAYAYDNSKFYRRKMEEIKIKPTDLSTLQDIKYLPITEKRELKENKNYNYINTGEKVLYSETSGSTGEPLVFYRNKTWDAWHRASIYRGYSWHGIAPHNRNGYLWGFDFENTIKIKILDFLQNRFRLFSYDQKSIDNFIKKLSKAEFLKGYSSMIYYIAKYLNNNNIHLNNLKLIIGTSEKIYDHYNMEAMKAFGKKIVSEYGAAETGIIAFECEKGNMHLNMETCIVEQDNNNQIIVTNLFSHSFPIIRYKLGDYIELDYNTKCPCGRKHPILKEIKGRVGKNIYGNKNIYPSLTLYYVFKNLSKALEYEVDYQVIQEKKGYLIIKIFTEKNNEISKLLRKEINKYFSDDLQFEISFQKNIELERKGKFTDFISFIDNEDHDKS